MKKTISIVVPCFNESAGITEFYTLLSANLPVRYNYELLFVDDGSWDATADIVRVLASRDRRIRLIVFSRNFGKESATTAGVAEATGSAVIILDSDGQHPVELIAEFIARWEKGYDIIVGVRSEYQKEGMMKKYGSKLFYKLFNKVSGTRLIPGATDYRLIDADVRQEFLRLSERNRITRGLIDWLGFRVDYIEFIANPRLHGQATYDTKKLIKLAMNSFVSMSFTPLYLGGYLGLLIILFASILGGFVIIEQLLLGDPLNLNISGSAMLGILILFLVGLSLGTQGLMALYISSIYSEVKARPLYIIDRQRSVRP